MVTPHRPRPPVVDTSPTASVAELLELYREPPWMGDALCREHPDLDWIEAEAARRGRERAQCLDVCGRCAVLLVCREYAVADVSLVGLWGGTDTAARRAIRRNRARGG